MKHLSLGVVEGVSRAVLGTGVEIIIDEKEMRDVVKGCVSEWIEKGQESVSKDLSR
jgi:hypothetical protein